MKLYIFHVWTIIFKTEKMYGYQLSRLLYLFGFGILLLYLLHFLLLYFILYSHYLFVLVHCITCFHYASLIVSLKIFEMLYFVDRFPITGHFFSVIFVVLFVCHMHMSLSLAYLLIFESMKTRSIIMDIQMIKQNVI